MIGEIFIWSFSSIGIALIVLTAWYEGRQTTVRFLGSLIILVVLTPLFGYLVLSLIPKRKDYRWVCSSCGNSSNESVYCGICGKNIDGVDKPEICDEHIDKEKPPNQ